MDNSPSDEFHTWWLLSLRIICLFGLVHFLSGKQSQSLRLLWAKNIEILSNVANNVKFVVEIFNVLFQEREERALFVHWIIFIAESKYILIFQITNIRRSLHFIGNSFNSFRCLINSNVFPHVFNTHNQVEQNL